MAEWNLMAVFSINNDAEEGAEDRYEFETHEPHSESSALSDLIDEIYENGESQEIPDIEYDAFYTSESNVVNCIIFDRDNYHACILELEDGTNLFYDMDDLEDEDGLEEEGSEEDGLE